MNARKFLRRCQSVPFDGAWYRRILRQEPCVYCGSASEGLDHIIAATMRGSNGWENRAPACHFCDSLKGNEPMLLFLVFVRRARLKEMTDKKLRNTVLNHFRTAREREQQLLTRRYFDFKRTAGRRCDPVPREG